jgi:hypothetical protein
MPGWGTSCEEEKRRQQAVVKKFINDHPEYDPKDDDNNRMLVDFIEASKRPFTSETMEWAYESLKLILQPKKKNIFQKISTALNNSNMSVAPPEPVIQDPTPEVAGYMSVNVMGKEYKVTYYSSEDVKTIKQGTYFSEEQVKDEILELAAVMEKAREPVIAVDAVPHPVYDKTIAPTKTQRRIKDDDD